MSSKAYIPTVQVRENCLCLYEVAAEPHSGKRHQLSQYNTYSGTVTEHAQKRIKAAVDIFLQKTPKRKIYNPVTKTTHDFRLSFITLTISQHERVEGKAGHEALKVFLQHFRRRPAKKDISEQVKSYLWKAELQERGQLHYHITTSSFLHFGEIRRVWNGIQYRRGWLDDFKREYGHTNPNSTDVHAVYKIRDVGAYLAKYLAKQEYIDCSEYGYIVPQTQRNIGAKTWDCSNDLKVKRFSAPEDYETNDRILRAIRTGKAKQIKLANCSIVQYKNPKELLSSSTQSKYDNWLT